MASATENLIVKSFNAQGNISPYAIIKFNSGDSATDLTVTEAGADEVAIGVSDKDVQLTAGNPVGVVVSGIANCIAAGTINRGVNVYSAAGGQATASGTNNPIGVSLTTAAQNEVVKVLLK